MEVSIKPLHARMTVSIDERQNVQRRAVVLDENATLDVVDRDGNRVAQIDLYSMGTGVNIEIKRLPDLQGAEKPGRMLVRCGSEKTELPPNQSRAEVFFRTPKPIR
jgi:hypothetical protein